MRKVFSRITIVVLFTMVSFAVIAQKANIKIHQYASDGSAIFSNAYIIELDKNLVIVDATLTVSSSKGLKHMADSLNKPIKAILVTHGHPDHYNGLGNLAAGSSIDIYSTQSVLNVIKESDAAKEKQWSPMFGNEWPKNRIFPNKILKNKETIKIDEVVFEVREIGPGESHSDSYWIMKTQDGEFAFIGDEVLNGVHAYLSDGHYKEWLSNLDKLNKELATVKLVYPGHGNAGGIEMFDWQKEYINTYVKNVKELLGTKDNLSIEDKQALTKKMQQFLTNDKLLFLVELGADAVVKELKEK